MKALLFLPSLFMFDSSIANATPVQRVQAALLCTVTPQASAPNCSMAGPANPLVSACELEYKAANCDEQFRDNPELKKTSGKKCDLTSICRDRLIGFEMGLAWGLFEGAVLDPLEMAYQILVEDGKRLQKHFRMKAEERKKLKEILSTLEGKRSFVEDVPSLSSLSDEQLKVLSIDDLVQRKHAFRESLARTKTHAAATGPRPTPLPDEGKPASDQPRPGIEALRNTSQRLSSLFQSMPGFQELIQRALALASEKLQMNHICFSEEAKGELVGYGLALIIDPAAVYTGAVKFTKGLELARGLEKRTAAVKAEARPLPKVTKIVQGEEQIEVWNLRLAGKREEAAAIESRLNRNLKSGEIVEYNKIGQGDSDGYFVKFKDGPIGVWKPATGWPANGNYEVAVYEIDRMLGLDRVPITVNRTLNGKEGTVQLFVGGTDRVDLQIRPEGLSFFDALIANRDRHELNYLTKDGRVVAIDHGQAFNPKYPNKYKEATERIMTSVTQAREIVGEAKAVLAELQQRARAAGDPEKYRASIERVQKQLGDAEIRYGDERVRAVHALASILPDKKVYDRLGTISENEWRRNLQDYLKPNEIDDFMKRRQGLIDSVERLRAEFGDMIFPSGPMSPLVRETAPRGR